MGLIVPRLTLSLLLVVLTAVVGIGWGIDRWYNAQVAEEEDPTLNAYKTLGHEIAVLIDSGSNVDHWLNQSRLQPQLIRYQDFPLPTDVKQSFEKGAPLLLESGDQLSLHFYLEQGHRVLSLTLPEELHSDTNNRVRWLLTLLFYSGVIAMVLVWLYPLLRRLALLRQSAQAFGAGQFHLRIPADTRSYIHRIELEFNRMAQRIEQLIADNKLLSSGLSHDLRTPLARLRFGLDILEEATLTPQQHQNLAHLNRDLASMESLVEAMLNYARLEQASIRFAPKSIELGHFVTQLYEDFYRDQVVLFIEPPTHSLCVLGDAEYLAMLLHNLLQNALRYGRGRVQLSLRCVKETLQVEVADNGSGIPPAEREKVLKPFYRSEGGDRQAQGHGLGLAIVERIAQWHDARLILNDSEALGGLSAIVVFTPQ